MTGLLEGVRVVEMGHIMAIPAAGAIMADWGAEVIKVEPLAGEMLRKQTRNQGVDIGIVKWGFEFLNRNKKGLALDLKKGSGRDILYRLVQRTDVFLSNYAVNALKGLKMDYTSLSAINPRLIYAVVTGYGTAGPDKDKGGGDPTVQSRYGIQYLHGESGNPPPVGRHGPTDGTGGLHALSGVLAALLYREKTGKGQELEVSLYHTGVWMLSWDIQHALVSLPMPPKDRTRAENPLMNNYRTKDDRWLLLTMGQVAVSWPDFCRAIERPELANDPRFKNLETASQHSEELVHILDEVFASKNREEWEKCLRENDLAYERVQTPLEVTTDPQAIANDFFVETEHPIVGKIKLVNTPVKFHQNPASVRTPAPALGQHNKEILLDLGYSWDDIARLKEQGVIL